MALAIDASTPDKTTVTGSGTSFVTNTFSPPAGSVIFLLITGTGSAVKHVQSVTSVTDSLGSHLSWTLFSGSQANFLEENTLEGTTEIWWATCPDGATDMTVTVTFAFVNDLVGATRPGGIILPVVFTGASTTQNGQVAIHNTTPQTTPSLSLTTSADGSWVIGIIQNYWNSNTPTGSIPAGQTITFNGHSSLAQNTTETTAFWAQTTTAATSTAGTLVTINDTAPTNITFHMSIVEVLADNGGGGGDNGSATVAWLTA